MTEYLHDSVQLLESQRDMQLLCLQGFNSTQLSPNQAINVAGMHAPA